MRDDQAGDTLAVREQALPELAFRFYIERAGEVIEDQQFRVAYEHTRRRYTLRLSAGKFDAPRSDHCIESQFQLCYIMLQHGGVKSCCQRVLVFHDAGKNIFFERV